MLTYQQIRALILGITMAHPATKGQLGQRFARHLGLEPEPPGPDGGVDGHGRLADGRKVHFQSKLSAKPLDVNQARMYYSDLKFHQFQLSVMLAGVGYKATFRERLFGHPDINTIQIHLLTLADLFGETALYQAALKVMPNLSGLPSLACSDWLIADSERPTEGD
jgi:hypothetical protein